MPRCIRREPKINLLRLTPSPLTQDLSTQGNPARAVRRATGPARMARSRSRPVPFPVPAGAGDPDAERHARLELLRIAAAHPEAFYLQALVPDRARVQASTPPSVPRCFVVRLSGRCNLACGYCFDRANRAARRDLDLPTAHRIAAYILQVPGDTPLVSLIGGEPLLNWEVGRTFLEILRRDGRARGKQPYFTIATNGTLITDALARELARDDITVQISIDGPAGGPRTHRRYPDGGDSVPAALEGLRRLRAVQPAARVDAQVVLTPGHVDLTGLARSLKAAGFRRIRYLHDTPGGADRGGWPAAEVRARLRARQAFYPYFLRSTLRGAPDVDMDLAWLVASQPAGPGGLCGCGRREVYIDAVGDLYPCPRLYGQAGVRPLGTCAHVDPAAPLPTPGTPRAPDTRCAACWAFESCRGGCAFQCQRCALAPAEPADPNQDLWCALLRAQLARAAITYRFLARFHPGRLASLRAIFLGSTP